MPKKITRQLLSQKLAKIETDLEELKKMGKLYFFQKEDSDNTKKTNRPK